MDTSQMQELRNIAHKHGVEYVYTAYIEEMLLYSRPFDAETLAKQILDAAMAKREARLRKCVNAILNSDRGPTVSQMSQARHLARTNGAMYVYISYIEHLISSGGSFYLEKCIETIFNEVMGDYKLRLALGIRDAAGVYLGCDDAV